jgi:hypothetical protein
MLISNSKLASSIGVKLSDLLRKKHLNGIKGHIETGTEGLAALGSG